MSENTRSSNGIERFATWKCVRCGRLHWSVTDGSETCDCGREVTLRYV